MGFDENLADLKAKINAVESLTDTQREVLTSDVLLSRIMPMMTAFVAENVTKVQETKDITGERIRDLADSIMKGGEVKEDILGFTKDLANGFMDASILDGLHDGLKDHWLAGPLMGMIVMAVNIITLMYNYMSVSAEKTKQIAAEDIRPFLLDLDTLIKELFRHPNNYGFVIDQMRKMGISEDKINIYLDNTRTFLPLEMLKLLWHREEISENDLDDRLRSLLIPTEDHDIVKKALFNYPGVQDLVRFAVREVFDDELATQLGLFSDLPPAFVDEAVKAGLPEKYVRMFWGAHWNPPPLSQTFQMYHRGFIDKDELMNLIRVNDYMPNYRQQLVDIAFNPITRVDLRRIYADGFIDFEQLVKGYMDLGYNEENATLISDWVDARYGEDRKEVTKADAVKLYKLGSYTYDDLFETLRDIGYTEEATVDIITKVDLEVYAKEKANIIKLMKKAYTKNSLTQGEISGKLTAFGLNTKEIDDLVTDWEIEIAAAIKYLPLETIQKIYKKEIWESPYVVNYLHNIGYDPSDTEALILLWDTEKGSP